MTTTITEQTTLENALTMMDVHEVERFNREKTNLSEADQLSLASKILNHRRATVQEAIYMGSPLSADDHRAKAKAHQVKADELKAGEKKDAQQAAADAHNNAADCIDAANKSSAKAELLS
jgi:hypothetical protein